MEEGGEPTHQGTVSWTLVLRTKTNIRVTVIPIKINPPKTAKAIIPPIFNLAVAGKDLSSYFCPMVLLGSSAFGPVSPLILRLSGISLLRGFKVTISRKGGRVGVV